MAEGRAKARLAILISGRGSNMEALVRAARADPAFPAEPVVVVSNRADAAGLGIAQALGVPTEVVESRARPREAFEDELDLCLRRHRAEVVALAGFMRVLTAGFVQRWEGRMLNIHPSLLPRHPGLDTHARALAAGDREAGATVHLVTPELDSGPILAQARVPVLPGDTEETLAKRVLAEEHRLYPQALAAFLAGAPAPAGDPS
jgi:phosphoribosylglycinamide formyltransferase-1